MILLHLHMRSGRTLAFELPDDDVRNVVQVVRERWRQPDPHHPEIGLGQGDDIDTYVLVGEIEAVELTEIPEGVGPG